MHHRKMYLTTAPSKPSSKWLMATTAQLCAMDRLVLVRPLPWMDRHQIINIAASFRELSIRFIKRSAVIQTTILTSWSATSKYTTSKSLICCLMSQEMAMVGQQFLFKMMPRARFMWEDCKWFTLKMKKKLLIFFLRAKQEKHLRALKWTSIVVELTVSIQSISKEIHRIEKTRKKARIC